MDHLQDRVNIGDSSRGDGIVLGPNRSIIRKIGSQLPLSNAERPTFELLPNGSNVLRPSGKKPMLFSLADIILLDDGSDSRPIPIRPSASAPNLNESMQNEMTVLSSASETSVGTANPQDHMVTKISALEDELASLRSQIAALVTSQHNNGMNESMSSTLGVPDSASTPIKAPPPCIPPPPPPPPPPPTPSACNDRLSVQDIIRQRKGVTGKSSVPSSRSKSQSSVPDMADILKDLHKVKLKSVSRSPGGTPFNKKKNIDIEPADGDPASLIAAALRKKFAHRKNFESPKSDDYDDSFEPGRTRNDSFGSPTQTPKFGPHLLKHRHTSPLPQSKPQPEIPSFMKKQRDRIEKSSTQT